jgi:hypothetical protein
MPQPANKIDDFYNYTIKELNRLIQITPAVKKISIKHKTPDYVTYTRDEWDKKVYPSLTLVTGVWKIRWNPEQGILRIG